MRWPGVMQSGELDGDTITKDLLAAFADALDDQRANRQREGDELALLIEQRLSSISEIVTDLRARMPEIVSGQRDKLRNRLAELQAELDSERLEQEMALIAQKADVDEELDRLDTHVKEVRRVLKKRRRGRSTPRLPHAGTQPRSQHPVLQSRRYRKHPSRR